uniref:Transposase (Putative), gypsy type n=1 Tax=Tanacetum cinerariifolium TaxID=118510 RepID=A0A6L2NXP0_TANCI|nr:hypothetical protein [Tanacetum cinerariifolium]
MDLFVFIHHSDPTKVRIWERDLAECEVKLLKMNEGRTVPLDPPVTAALKDSDDSIDKLFDDVDQEHFVERVDDVLEETIAKDASEKLRDDYHSLLPNTSGKSLAALRGMVSEGSGIPSDVTQPLIATSVAPMSDVGPLDFVFGPNLRTCPPHVRYVVSLDGSHHSGSYSEATSFVRSLVSDASVVTVVVTTTIAAEIAAFSGSKARDVSKDLENIRDSTFAGEANTDAASISKLNKPSTSSGSFYASQSLDTKTMHRIYVPTWKVMNDSILEDLYVCHDLTDRLAPSALFTKLRAMDYDQLYSEFNAGAARQVCLGAEFRIRVEHTLERNGELEDKCAEQTVLLSERDAEIAHLKSLLSLKESEATEAIRLQSEREGLFSQSSLEFAFELFSARMKATQDQQAKVLGTRVAELDAQLLEMVAHLGMAIGCAINKGIQDGLRARVDHRKARRDLSVSKKDVSIVDLMDSLRLEGPLAEIPRAEDLQPSPDQLRLPIDRPKDNVFLGETSLSFSLQSLTGEASTSVALVTVEPVTTLSTTFASSDVVPLLLTSDDQTSGVEPHDEEPYIMSFEKEQLVTSLK